MENIEIARVLNAYADLLELKVENRFRIRSYRASMSGTLRVEGGISPLGTPTMIGAIALHSAGIPSSAFDFRCVQGRHGESDHTGAESHGMGRKQQILRSQPAVGDDERSLRPAANDNQRAGVIENIEVGIVENLQQMTRLTRGVRRASAVKIVLARSERLLSVAMSCTMRMPRVLRAPPSVPTLPRRAVTADRRLIRAVAASRPHRAPIMDCIHDAHLFFRDLTMSLSLL